MPRIFKQTYTGTGLLTCCPSPTLTCLGLGPTNPGMIIMAQETLLFRWAGFSPALWLLIPAFSLDNTPPHLTMQLRCDINAPLPRAQRGNTKIQKSNLKQYQNINDQILKDYFKFGN